MGLGLHGGGIATAHFLARQGARVLVTDLRSEQELKPSLVQLKGIKNISYRLGEHRASDFLEQHLILKNPGVPPDSPFLKLARKHRIPVTSDMGIFFALCPAMIIGITGTRGKSTTASLISLFLQAGFKRLPRGTRPRVFLGGNIRRSVLEFLDKLKPADIVILELSSFQLQDLASDTFLGQDRRKSPDIAVLTNIMPDHLNWHGTMIRYIAAKKVIFQFQRARDHLFANPLDPRVKKIISRARSHVHFPVLTRSLEPIVDEILGSHYRQSVALAVGVAQHFGIKNDAIIPALKRFRGLQGRQEYIGEIHGAHVINDTTATMPDAAIEAIKRFRDKAGAQRLVLIAGGQDKGLDFKQLAKMIRKNVDVLILLPGTATEKLQQILGERGKGKGESKNSSPFTLHPSPLTLCHAGSMKDAVEMAFQAAEKGDYIVLSPGAASFGLFLNEFDRGEKFVKEVKKIQTKSKRAIE